MAKGRTIINEVLNQPADFVTFMVNDFLSKNGYVVKEKNGEVFYQNGCGLLTAPKFIKYNYANGVIHIEAWIKVVYLPGVYGSDLDLEGFSGSVIKAAMKKEINTLIKLLHQPLPNTNAAGMAN